MKSRAQSILEYVIIMSVVAAAVVGIPTYSRGKVNPPPETECVDCASLFAEAEELAAIASAKMRIAAEKEGIADEKEAIFQEKQAVANELDAAATAKEEVAAQAGAEAVAAADALQNANETCYGGGGGQPNCHVEVVCEVGGRGGPPTCRSVQVCD